MNRRENVVEPLLVKLEVLVHRAGKEPSYVSAGVAAETRCRAWLSASPAAQLASLLEETYGVSVFSHIVGGYQTLMTAPNHYHIETCVSHWYLLL
jgi:hypothetical protein